MTKDINVKTIDLTLVKPCRLGLHKDAVEKYTQVLLNADKQWIFPALTCCTIDGTTYLLDGQHRYQSALNCELKFVPCNFVEMKDIKQARRYALCANSRHGERLTREEMRNNITAYILEGGMIESDTQIALAFGVSRALIADIRASNNASKDEQTDKTIAQVLYDNPLATIKELAEATGLNRKTVAVKVKTMRERDDARKGVITDCFGREIPQDVKQKYLNIRNALTDALNMLKDTSTAVNKLVKAQGFSSTNDVDVINSSINQIKYILKERKPDALCSCRGDGCRVCGGVGFLSKELYKTLIKE